MTIFLFLFFCIVGLFWQKSKFLSALIFFFCWSLAWCKDLPDYDVYNYTYQQGKMGDIGYDLIANLFLNIGCDYFQFRLFYMGLGLLIFCWFIIKFANRCSLVSSLYLYSMFLLDVVQYRNFVAFAIILIGIYVLIKYKSPKNNLLYAVIVCIAGTFHITVLFYLIFIFSKETIKKISLPVLISVGITCILIINYFFVTRLQEKFDAYNYGVSNLTRSLLFILFIGNLIFVKIWSRKQTQKLNVGNKQLTQLQQFFVSKRNQYVLYFNYALILILPGAFMSLSALRLYRYMGVINYAYIADKFNQDKYNIFNTIILLFYATAFLGLMYLMHSTQMNYILNSVFNQNLFY